MCLFNRFELNATNELFNKIVSKGVEKQNNRILGLCKITLANNLILSLTDENSELQKLNLSQKYLKTFRDFIKDGVFSLYSENDPDAEESEIKERNYIRELIDGDESETLEFKSSLCAPVPRNDKTKIQKKLEEEIVKRKALGEVTTRLEQRLSEINGNSKAVVYSWVKTLAAFANSKGGRLIFGVDDTKKVLGLALDIEQLNASEGKERDVFLKFFDEKIIQYLGRNFLSDSIENRKFIRFPEGEIFIVLIKKGNKETFVLKDEDGNSMESLYIRGGASTHQLTGRELANFIRTRG